MTQWSQTKIQLSTNNDVSDRFIDRIDELEFQQGSQLMTPVHSHSNVKRLIPENKVSQLLFQRVYNIDHQVCEPGEEDPFFVCDLSEIKRLYANWQFRLPRVHPFYAVKCNNNPKVLETLIDLGAGFDCASKGEIETMLSLGVDASRIVYANPCKSSAYVRYSEQNQINLTTFDNADELIKMKKYHPNSRLLLRIVTDDETAQCRLSTKFGADMENSLQLLELAKQLNLDVAGVAFHVGSGSIDANSWIKAISDSKTLFKYGAQLGFNMDILDIGGGFVTETFDELSILINNQLDTHFHESEFPQLKIIAEPGRYMSATAFTLACHVIAKRSYIDPKTGNQSTMVYLNDGVYGNLNCIIYDHQKPVARTLTHNNEFYHNDSLDYDNEVSIWGPTCDGLDCISKSTYLKFIPEVGDWIYFDNVGAYTLSASTPFNGFTQHSDVEYAV